MKKNWWLPLIFLVVMIFVMRYQGASLVTPVSPNGIIDLEFARTATKLQQLQLFWNPNDLALNIYLDFLLIIAYVWFLAAASWNIQQKTGWLRPGKWAITLAMGAGFLDVLENFLMMLVYNGRFEPGLLQFIFAIALLKFTFIILVVLFVIAALPFVFFKKPGRLKKPKTYI